MKTSTSFARACLVPLLVSLLWVPPGPAWSAKAAPAEGKAAPVKKPKAAKAAKPAKKAAGSKVTFMPGSQESPADRRARLTRECKGGVDAGACTGYTR